jgi:hypothetical protein
LRPAAEGPAAEADEKADVRPPSFSPHTQEQVMVGKRIRITEGEFAGKVGTIRRLSEGLTGWIVRIDGQQYEAFVKEGWFEVIG